MEDCRTFVSLSANGHISACLDVNFFFRVLCSKMMKLLKGSKYLSFSDSLAPAPTCSSERIRVPFYEIWICLRGIGCPVDLHILKRGTCASLAKPCDIIMPCDLKHVKCKVMAWLSQRIFFSLYSTSQRIEPGMNMQHILKSPLAMTKTCF